MTGEKIRISPEEIYQHSWANSPPDVQTSPNSRHKLWLTWMMGGAVFLLAAFVFIAVRSAIGTHQGSTESRIATVLDKDADVTTGVTTVAEVVAKMRALDLTGCPNDFSAAYLAHIHAWETLADVESDVSAFKSESESGAVFVESMIRGFLGDPFGKVIEISDAQSALQQRAHAANQKIQETYRRVEEIAVLHGASLPKRAGK
jgi:hypothetical protein